MFCNHHCLRRQQRSRLTTQQPQRRRVFLRRVVGRIKKHQVEGLWPIPSWLAQKGPHAAGLNAKPRPQSEPFQIAAQHGNRRRSALDEADMSSPTAQRLHPHRARTGVKIEERRALNARRQHIEKGLAQPVAGGPCGQPGRSLQCT